MIRFLEFRKFSRFLVSHNLHFTRSLQTRSVRVPVSDLSSASPSSTVGIFWDLDNKPPNSFPPYHAARRLKLTAASFGYVKYMIAYANHHAFQYVPDEIKEERKERKMLNHLENKGIIKSPHPYLCRVCGRKFYTNTKLVNHFKQIHEREQTKRLNQIESARGNRRVKLVAKYAMKMDKYRNASRDVLIPKVGYGLADELKRAGFWVRTVSDKPQAADIALKNHMIDLMDHKRVECLMLVSDDSDFVGVLRDARERCLRTVVVGENGDGPLKRCADSSFSWREVLSGKTKKQAPSVVRRWRDKDILKRLEWNYNPENEAGRIEDFEEEEGDIDVSFVEKTDNKIEKGDGQPWWKLESDTEEQT